MVSRASTTKGKQMSNSPNSTGRRRAGRVIGIGPSKRWARRLVARICRSEGKIIARNRGEERYKRNR